MLAYSYARFSSDNQDEKSNEDQEKENEAYAKKNGISILRFYRDEAKSGTKDNREDFKKMIDDCIRKKEVQVILVWKFNRFARNTYDSAIYKKKLKDIGIRVISVTQKIDDTPEGMLLERLIEGVDEYYSLNLASDVTRGLEYNAKQFKFNGGTPPLGYKIIDNKYVIDENEAKIIKEIFNLYLDGKSLMDIAIEMNNKGYKTRFNNNFKHTSIFSILDNEKYIGTYKYKIKNEEYIQENAFESIVSKEDFEKVKEIRKNNTKHKGVFSAKENYLLSTLIKCNVCGGNYVGMTRTKKKDNKLYKYKWYGCNNRNKLSMCNGVYIDANKLEKYSLDLLRKKLLDTNSIDDLLVEINTIYNDLKPDIKDTFEDSKKELKNINQKLGNLIKSIEDGLYSNTIKEQIENLESRKIILTDILNTSEKHISIEAIDKDFLLASFHKDLDTFENFSVEDRKKILKKYIKKIEVDHYNLTFYFNLKNLDNYSSSDMEPLVRLELTTY